MDTTNTAPPDLLSVSTARIADERTRLRAALKNLLIAAKTLNERHPDFIAALNQADLALRETEGSPRCDGYSDRGFRCVSPAGHTGLHIGPGEGENG